MKTAISLPDELFRQAESFARRNRKSRSQLYADAMSEYLARHAADSITEKMNLVCDSVDQHHDAFTEEAARRVLSKVEW